MWDWIKYKLGVGLPPPDWVDKAIRELVPVCSTTRPARIKYFLPKVVLSEKERLAFDEGKAIWFSSERVEELDRYRIPVAYDGS